ncbi:MFS transporter [Streptomyces sp. NPDC057743]|uniref:MFS transporter n=1 Tax=Streptomyces sp. NPDC057743 TaxID=3346236 RepID=UPI0036C89501
MTRPHDTVHSPPAHHSPSIRYGRQVLSVTSFTGLLTGLNTSGLDVALPDIVGHFHASAAQTSWIMVGYLLSSTVLLLVWGRLADLFGRRRLYLAGIAAFTLASIGCVLAPNAWILVLGRVLQGVGASAVITNTTALLADAFPPERLTKALGVNAILISATQAAGPLLGGVLTNAWGWSGVFWTSGVAGLAALGWSAFVLRPDHGSGSAERFDLAGALLSMVFLGGGALALTGSGPRGGSTAAPAGWTSAPVLLSAALSVAALLVFPVVQSRRRYPLLDPWLFRDRRRTMALLAAFLTAVSFFSVVLVMSLYLQTVEHLDPLSAGLQVMLMSVGAMLTAPLAGRLATRYPARLLSSVGTATSALGIAILVIALGPPAPPTLTGLGLFLTGAGAGIFGVPNTGELMTLVPPHRRGIANGVRSALQSAGYLISTGLSLALVTVHGPQADRTPDDIGAPLRAMPAGSQALAESHRTALLALLCLCLAATGVSLLRGGTYRPAPEKTLTTEGPK